MFCPQCGAEFREGFDHCSDCDVDLVRKSTLGDDSEEDHTLREYETVLETSTSEEILVVKSLLESASIPFLTEGEVMNELFPADTMVTLFNPHYMVAFKVPKEQAQEARDLLSAQFDEKEISELEDSLDDDTGSDTGSDSTA